MQEIAQYFENRFFNKQVLDFHSPFKVFCHTSKLCNFVKITGPSLLLSKHLYVRIYLFLVDTLCHGPRGDDIVHDSFRQGFGYLQKPVGDHSYLNLETSEHKLSFQSSELGPPSLTRKGVLLLPPFRSKGGDTLACGGWGWMDHFRRRDTLGIL